MSYFAGCNISGFMPDTEPQEYEDFDHAKRAIIQWIKWEEDCVETEEEAEELCALAEAVNLESGEFNYPCLGKRYWIEKN